MAEEVDNNNPALKIEHKPYTINDTLVHIHILHLNNSQMLWINKNTPSMENLAVATQTKYEKSATAVNLLGDMSDPISANLAQRLSKRTGKQTYVSCNLPGTDTELLPKVEQLLIRDLIL
ncbi:unnamed protein product [Clavelina lepadiformis]|uniref:Proteasome assembly chaperone 4 n=1 Tax=Clavelina lepadiformis TaxID=159417 RepID=A0ABP0GAJ0_CLALP